MRLPRDFPRRAPEGAMNGGSRPAKCPRRPQLSEADIGRLADISGIPLGQRLAFAASLRRAVQMWWLHGKDWKAWGSLFSPVELDDAVAQLDRLQRSVAVYQKALQALGEPARDAFEVSFDKSSAPSNTFDRIERLTRKQFDAASMAYHQMLGEKRGKGRPSCLPGQRGHTALDAFVCQILEATGGRLTLDKNRESGSLIDFLRAVSPYLPPGFIPNSLPYSRFQALKTHWTKTQAPKH